MKRLAWRLDIDGEVIRDTIDLKGADESTAVILNEACSFRHAIDN